MKMRSKTVPIVILLFAWAVIAGFAPQACMLAYADEGTPGITKAPKGSPASVETAPQAKELAYSSAPLVLVTEGTAVGGTMQYALGNNNTNAPGSGWSTSIPEETLVGKYYVWYKVVGDSAHEDSDPVCVVVRINKRKLTITAANQEYIYNGSWQGPGDIVYDDPAEIAEKVIVDGLQGNDYIVGVVADGQGDVPGESKLVVSGVNIGSSQMEGNAKSQYDVEFIDGILTILPIPLHVTITGSSAEKVYNGKEQTYEGAVTATCSDEAFDASKFNYTGSTVVKGTQAGEYTRKLEQKYCTYDSKFYKPEYTFGNPIKLTIKQGTTTISGTLLAKMTAKGKNTLVLTWTKVKGVDGYDIFFIKCKNTAYKKVKTIKGNTTFKWTKKKLKKGVAYKARVKAWVKTDGKKKYVRNSPGVHAYTSGGDKEHTHAKSVTVKKTRVTLKQGKSHQIKAKVKKLQAGKKLMPSGHAPALRYVSGNKKIATVSASGKIKAKAKGTCKVYVIAVNGIRKAITVTVT